MLTKSILALVATSALAAKLIQHFSHKQRLRRAHDDKRLHREDVHRWEAEGGNLPTPQTAAKSPAKPPAKRRAPRAKPVSP
ncbi:hypothetical protein J2X20_000752 [Pelomonas saccharophila]|uniref:Uncharacterized protein n=1 Tax=Roseateles saccharophilus TaxID=304 RepID=A0ABU1YHC2_ROSSA|nr:hypothetical protein [Roseateles saccharophilus]MDR7268123.1 hypothetical protein [Roseateles saccharophilus]